MSMKDHTTFAVGQPVGKRIIVAGPEMRPFGRKRVQDLACWLLRCRCGTETWVLDKHLREGLSRIRRGHPGATNMACRSCSRMQHTGVEIEIGRQVGLRRVAAGPRIWKGKTRWQLECVCGCRTWRTATEIVYERCGRGCHSCGKATARNAKFKAQLEGLTTFQRRTWNTLLHGAEERNLPVTVPPAEVFAMLESQGYRCALSGSPIYLEPDWSRHQAGESTASVDRIDSSRGYEPGNVQWVHKDVNRLKNNLPEAELLRLCRLLVAHADRR